MKYISKFNELNTNSVLSSDKIAEINVELSTISEEINDNTFKITKIIDDLSAYTSKDEDKNNQIDDAYVDLKTLTSRFGDILGLIEAVNTKLKNYSENGTQYLA